MKTREGFVSNSSSTSFIVAVPNLGAVYNGDGPNLFKSMSEKIAFMFGKKHYNHYMDPEWQALSEAEKIYLDLEEREFEDAYHRSGEYLEYICGPNDPEVVEMKKKYHQDIMEVLTEDLYYQLKWKEENKRYEDGAGELTEEELAALKVRATKWANRKLNKLKKDNPNCHFLLFKYEDSGNLLDLHMYKILSSLPEGRKLSVRDG